MRAAVSLAWSEVVTVLDLAPYPALLVARDGRIRLANQDAAALLGYPADELLERSVDDLVPADGRGRHAAHRRSFDDRPRPLGHARDLVALRRDDTLVPVEVSLQPCTVDGEPAILCTLIDITERQRAQRALIESERRYREVTELAPDIIYQFALEEPPRLVFINAAVERVLGYAPSDFYGGEDLWTIFHPDDLPGVFELFARGSPGQVEVRAFHRDGSTRILAAHFAMSPADHGVTHVHGIARDVTAHRATEAKLVHAEAQLLQSQKLEAVGRLAGGVAHDFNNLLTVIVSFATFVSDQVSESDPIHSDVEQILEAARRAAALTSQLLAFSRKRAVQPRVLDIGQHVSDMTKMLARLLGEDIELVTRISDEPWPTYLDPGAFEQVVVNLAVNARDAMRRGGTLTVAVDNAIVGYAGVSDAIEPVAPGDYVTLTIADTGCGMDADTLDTAFEPFFTTKPAGEGTGLGLSTCYGIVTQAGGGIAVDSELGRGTRFTVYFPRTARVPQPALSTSSSLPRGNGETVLVVEDNRPLRALAVRLLGALGYQALAAESGGDALLLCEQHAGEIDLLLTDVVMPRMSGRELAERLLLVRPTLRVLYMSGYTADIIAHHGVLEEGTELLHKPFRREELAVQVRNALDRDRS